MLAYRCENCKQINLWGYLNEFDQFFCDENCYDEYCLKNDYERHFNKLHKLKTPFD